MAPFEPALPIDTIAGELLAALDRSATAVLVAPPGAGKTTRVPLWLARQSWAAAKRILVLEPRRLAARAAAGHMAAALGEIVGETVGLRVRFGSRVGPGTRIEIVTEGVFTRLILDDPSLAGIAAVVFDEFHERSLDADLGLALARDAQLGLREDLRLLVMSATLEGARVSQLLGNAPIIKSTGRAFPVETIYHARDPRTAIETQVAHVVVGALREHPGSILVFLPGAAEIQRTQIRLQERVGPAIDILPLHATLPAAAQDLAITPASAGRRKVVLATSIAETSLTIEGVRIVVDCGLARVPRYEPNVGLTRLETVRVSRAGADQRRGRAGRTEPGVCVRLWEEAQTASLEAFAKPEILAADLSAFVLDVALWGCTDPAELAFLDQPPSAALDAARKMLCELGALDTSGRITDSGRQLRSLPLPPRLARMVLDAAVHGNARSAAEIAAVLTERGLGGDALDLGDRLDAFRRDRSRRAEDARHLVRRWADWAASPNQGHRDVLLETSAGLAPPLDRPAHDMSVGVILALAYPDRIARARTAQGGQFLLANGRGALIDPLSGLCRQRFLAVAELAGTATHARILLAASLDQAEIEKWFAGRIETRDEITVDPVNLTLRGRQTRRLGAVVVTDQPFRITPDAETAAMLAAAVAQVGLDRLPWNSGRRQWRDRVMFMRRVEGEAFPDLSDCALADNVAQWLAPVLVGKTSLGELGPEEFAAALTNLLPHQLRRRLDAAAPTHFAAPSGSRIPIDYGSPEGPKLSVRLQELFGLDRHPTIATGIPISIELLSPAQRPVQVTSDLPGFWRGSYHAVRTEMRGRYPRHPWPENPLTAPPTRRPKPRA